MRTHFMTRFIATAASAVLLIFSGACSSLDSSPKDGKKSPYAERREKQAKLAESKGQRMLHAYQKGNADQFLKELPPVMKQKFGKQEFKDLREDLNKNMGEVVHYELLTQLKSPIFRTHIWKVTVKRNGSDGKVYSQEILFRTVSAFTQDTDEPYLVNFGFM